MTRFIDTGIAAVLALALCAAGTAILVTLPGQAALASGAPVLA